MDTVAPSHDDGSDRDAADVYKVLHRFGEAAKHELLNKAVSKDPGWRNLASAVLAEWQEWSSSDVPELRAALRKDPGGWVARPLAKIATPEAIEALVEDLPKGSENQTDFALASLGSKAIPYVFPLLATESGGAGAARVIAQMTGVVGTYAPKWAAMAADPKELMKRRVKALAGIAALGPAAKPYCENLRKFLKDPDLEFQSAVRASLIAVRDSSTAADVARECKPSAAPLDSLAIRSLRCLEELASYGTDGVDAGAELMPFLKSMNGAERANAITTLGAIEYAPAIPEIETALADQDWRVSYAAARSLGWLGAKDSIPALQKTASQHWLPEIREEAHRAAGAIQSPTGKLTRFSKFGAFEDNVEFFEPTYTEIKGKVPRCHGLWKWNGLSFEFHEQNDSLQMSDGTLRGSNHGEWGGELKWHPIQGNPDTLHSDNVVSIERDGGGAIAVFGLAHMSLDYGYAVRASRDNNGRWKLNEVARLLGQPSGLVPLGDGLFAAGSEGRVIVFSSDKGILGLATCQN